MGGESKKGEVKMNKVINACYEQYKREHEVEVNPKLKAAMGSLTDFEDTIKELLPQDKALTILNNLASRYVAVQDVLTEEYFEAGFVYGREL